MVRLKFRRAAKALPGSPPATALSARGPISAGATRAVLLASLLACPGLAHASMLGCEQKNADPAYCQNGVGRAVCLQSGVVVWADTRLPVTAGELGFLSSDGPVAKSACAPAPAAAPAAPKPKS